ncbi:MAG: hypothetical protein PUD39_02390, partial [Bacteroidales bacterium]|nr:hypothetical protein [Bacteroidales bacterium]
YVDNLTYQLVFTVPPTKSGDNFVLYPANHQAFSATTSTSATNGNAATSATQIPASVRAKRDAFVSSAQAIFNRHNKGVTSYD